MSLTSADIVLVIGGWGFLGQHIIKHLLSQTDVQEIRVLDKKSFTDNHITADDDRYDVKRVQSFIGDVRKLADVVAVMDGCTAVIHCAAFVDFRLFPDIETLHDINVKGTSNVIEACVQCNVPSLVFTSSVDVALSNRDIINGDEKMSLPDRCLIHGYGHSKRQAETLVRNADGRPLSGGNDQTLRTVCLRPSVMYGEGDPYLIPTAISAASFSGFLMPVGNGTALSQHAYVGNVAWGHVCALRALSCRDPSRRGVSGCAFFINDDTPLMNAFQFFELFLSKCGLSVCKFRIPFWIVFILMSIVQCLVFTLRLVIPVNLQTTLGSLVYVNRTIYFSRAFAEEHLGYTPKFDFVTSLDRSLRYYVEKFG